MSARKAIIKNQLIKALFYDQELPVADLSVRIGKSIPSTQALIQELKTEGVILEQGFASSTGGRRAQVYSLRRDLFCILAVAMDQLETRVALIDNSNELIGEIRSYNLTLKDNPNALEELIGILREFLNDNTTHRHSISGIGIGMPGFIDPKLGINHSFFEPRGISISGRLEDEFDLPVFIDNDSSLIALAEHKWGAARGYDNAMVVNIGWGVGLGMIVEGKLFRGHNGFAGEFSHISIFNNHIQCSCGKYGCLETESSLIYLGNLVRQNKKANTKTMIQFDEKTPGKDIAKRTLQAAKSGDRFALETLSIPAYNIGRGLAILIHLLNPEMVVISGLGALAGKVWLAPVQQGINEHSILKLSEQTNLTLSSLKYDAHLYGATALVMDQAEKLNFKSKPAIAR